MAIHPSFPQSPYQILDPDYRWFPADEALRESSYDKLLFQPAAIGSIPKKPEIDPDPVVKSAKDTIK